MSEVNIAFVDRLQQDVRKQLDEALNPLGVNISEWFETCALIDGAIADLETGNLSDSVGQLEVLAKELSRGVEAIVDPEQLHRAVVGIFRSYAQIAIDASVQIKEGVE